MANLELYRIFVTVAKEKNITKASEKLNISQPAVTKHIKNLENELNTTLFIRTKGMALTEDGQRLYEDIEPSINAIINAENKILHKNSIRFGIYSTMISKVLNESIAKFYETNKEAKIDIITEPFNSLFDKFLEHKLDVALLKKEETSKYNKDEIKCIDLGNIDFIMITNNNSKLYKKIIDLTDLQNKLIYMPRGKSTSSTAFEKMLKDNNIQAEIKKIDSITISNIIQNHDAIALVNQKYIEQDISAKKVRQIKTSFTIPSTEYAIYVYKENKSKALKEFINIIKSNYNQKL